MSTSELICRLTFKLLMTPRVCRGLVFAVPLALLTSCPSPAREQYAFDSWTTDNGLPQNSVNDILQTRDGYLWLATFGGLVRFDGVRFVVFDRSTDGIESQRVRALYEDRHGTLWAATEDGMLIRHRDGQFRTYTSRDGLPHEVAVRIEEAEDGSLWVTWAAGALTRFDGRFTSVERAQLARPVESPPTVQLWDRWWSVDASGLHVLVNGQVLTYDVADVLKARITGVNTDGRENVWIRTAGAGAAKAASGRLTLYTVREGLPTNDPEGTFHEDASGDIWFWDYRDNLYRIRSGAHEPWTCRGHRRWALAASMWTVKGQSGSVRAPPGSTVSAKRRCPPIPSGMACR